MAEEEHVLRAQSYLRPDTTFADEVTGTCSVGRRGLWPESDRCGISTAAGARLNQTRIVKTNPTRHVPTHVDQELSSTLAI